MLPLNPFGPFDPFGPFGLFGPFGPLGPFKPLGPLLGPKAEFPRSPLIPDRPELNPELDGESPLPAPRLALFNPLAEMKAMFPRPLVPRPLLPRPLLASRPPLLAGPKLPFGPTLP